jgi:peptide methionine sulfoxide reductase msrA/msrB
MKSGQNSETAIFAAGCFWGVQDYFDHVPGVLETEVGYIGGHVDHPTYQMVSAHVTGHAEGTKIIYNPKKVSFRTLIKHFFRMHDPTQFNRQGPDVGDNYRSAIFYLNEEQKLTAQKIIDKLNQSGRYKKPVVTTLESAVHFWPAEDYHQKYVQKTGIGACHIDYAPV